LAADTTSEGYRPYIITDTPPAPVIR
jgi:hypothetical protein